VEISQTQTEFFSKGQERALNLRDSVLRLKVDFFSDCIRIKVYKSPALTGVKKTIFCFWQKKMCESK
jgi:hypothetical protein